MGLVRHSDVAALRAVLRTRIAASRLGSGYNCIREQVAPPLLHLIEFTVWNQGASALISR
jgi:hypothetical protein